MHVMTVRWLVWGHTHPEWHLSLIKFTPCDHYSLYLSRESFKVVDINIILKYLALIQKLVVWLALYWVQIALFYYFRKTFLG